MRQAERLVTDATARGRAGADAVGETPPPATIAGSQCPRVIADATPEMAVCREDCFAPLMAVLPFDELPDALTARTTSVITASAHRCSRATGGRQPKSPSTCRTGIGVGQRRGRADGPSGDAVRRPRAERLGRDAGAGRPARNDGAASGQRPRRQISAALRSARRAGRADGTTADGVVAVVARADGRAAMERTMAI